MRFREIISLSQDEKLQIISLWNQEYPKQLKHDSALSFDNYLSGLSNARHLLLCTERREIKGWYIQFVRDHEVWFAMILDSDIHGQGFGSKLLETAKQNVTKLNGWVIDHNHYTKENGEAYQSPLSFYLKNGFEVLDDIRLELDHLSAVQVRWRSDIL